MNKYNKWYTSIILNATTRTKLTDTYVEKHHIIPRSLGGTDSADNLVELTAREHFICHWLLTKMYTGEERGKMINAMYMMKGQSTRQKRYESTITGRIYKSLREEYVQYISNMNTGRVQPADEKARQKSAQIGRIRPEFSTEWKANLSAAKVGKNNNRFGIIMSDDTKKKIGDKIRGRKQTDEEKAQRSAANIGKKRVRLDCPYCNKNIAVNTYAMWHGDKCKLKP